MWESDRQRRTDCDQGAEFQEWETTSPQALVLALFVSHLGLPKELDDSFGIEAALFAIADDIGFISLDKDSGVADELLAANFARVHCNLLVWKAV